MDQISHHRAPLGPEYPDVLTQHQNGASTKEPHGFRNSMRELSGAQKRGAGEPAYLRWVNRPLGRVAAAAAHSLRMSPNTVSLLSAAFSIAGIAVLAFATPSIGASLAATGLLAIGYVLDSADGQLARLSGRGSPAGEWLDHVLDSGRIPLFHIGVAVSFYLRPDSETLWQSGVALTFAVVGSVRFFAHNLADKIDPSIHNGVGDAPVWHSFAKLPLDVGFVYLTVLTLPLLVVFSWLYAALFAVTLLLTIAALRRKYLSLVSP